MIALVGAGALAFPSGSQATDYGRWRVTASGHLTESWQSAATTPCAITGHGGVDLSFKTSHPITVHLRRKAKLWTVRSPTVLSYDVTATVSGEAVQQPPPSADEPCQWPAPDTWSCGPLGYSARNQMLGGGSGVALADTHYFEFPPARHEPGGHECGHSANANLQLQQPTHGKGDPFFRLSPARVRHRRRMVLTEHGDGPTGATYDERTPYDVSATRRRDTTLVLVPIR